MYQHLLNKSHLYLLTYLRCLLRMMISLNNFHVFLSRIYNESVQSCGIFIRQYLADINEVGASGDLTMKLRSITLYTNIYFRAVY